MTGDNNARGSPVGGVQAPTVIDSFHRVFSLLLQHGARMALPLSSYLGICLLLSVRSTLHGTRPQLHRPQSRTKCEKLYSVERSICDKVEPQIVCGGTLIKVGTPF